MKAFCRILFLLFFISLSFARIGAQENQSIFLHTVEKGQSLFSISKMYDVTTMDIIQLNPGCDEKIYAGQSLKIPRERQEWKGETFHTIQAGETLYKLTTLYNISAQTICNANPGLSAENFRTGQVVRIPLREVSATTVPQEPTQPVRMQGPVESRCREMHRVKRKETVFSVSRQYGISEQELLDANAELRQGMKKGQLLCIPYPKAIQNTTAQESTQAAAPSNKELFHSSKIAPRRLTTVKAALLLPFREDKRMIEYYEGFLMAADSLKRTGVSLDLYIHDCGKDLAALNAVLDKGEMKKMDIIFGPMHQEQIPVLSDFARKNDIRLVIPFSPRGEEVFNNPVVYQINTPQSYLYSEVYEHFTRQFPNAHVIFIEPATPDKEKADFVNGLKQELKSKGISMQTVSESATKEMLKEATRSGKSNVFLPTTGKNVLLIKALPQLTLLVRENPELSIHLFGYPEWQTYTKDHLEAFFELDTHFYSSFYTNTLFPSAVQFTAAYHKWYGKELASKFPNYAMLGFDTGFFFLRGLALYGSELEDNLAQMNLTPIQTGFNFRRVNNWGGFINKKVFFIRFTKGFELVKLDFE